MSIIKANGAGDQDTGFYNGVATQSLRLNNSASSLLTRTPSAGDRKTWTWSAWIKRSDTGRDQDFFTAEGSGAQLFAIMITSGDQIQIYGANSVLLLTNQLSRDLSAWYNIVVKSDTTQGTAANRLKLYVNGSEVTSFATDNRDNYAQNTDYGINSNVKHNIGSNQAGGNFGHYYIAEVNFVDGTALDASYFGETKNGVWIPKKYTGSYGTQGFRLEFKQTGDGSSTASSSTIGADTANSNHYKDTNLDAHDSNMPDSPENNFATMGNMAFPLTNDNISEGNLKVGQTDQHVHVSTFGIPTSGKWYWEVNTVSSNGSNYYAPYTGVVNSTFFHTYQAQTGNAGDDLRNTAGLAYIRGNDTNYKNLTGTAVAEGSNKSGEDTTTHEQGILGLALDSDAGTLKYYWNNSLARTDSTLTAGDLYFPYQFGTNSGSNSWNFNYFNFGQDSSFAGTLTGGDVGTATDGNGNGKFKYAPPTSHLALCTDNIPEPVIGPNSDTQANDHFNTVLYTGNAGTLNVTGVGFQPDWVWIKSRAATRSHMLYDSNRGVQKAVRADLHNAEISGSTTLTAFDTDGFTLGADSDVNTAENFVSWNWKANGGTTTTNDASATGVGSIDTVIQADTIAGFSIVTFTGNNTTNSTIGHGVKVNGSAKTPAWILTKNRDDTTVSSVNQSWRVWHKDLTDTYVLFLDRVLYQLDPTAHSNGYIHDVTSTTYKTTHANVDSNAVNGASDKMLAYCFAEVEGYSKFGVYEGNGSADGTFVYTGFRPAWVLIKHIDTSMNYSIVDSVRDNINDSTNDVLFPDGNFAENTSNKYLDFVSNGIKFRGTSAGVNASATYVYAAFAEQPFKYANAK